MEENKVAQKLADIIRAPLPGDEVPADRALALAYRILQSPDLRGHAG